MCDAFTSSSATLAYIVVVFILTCPKIFCTSVIGVPLCRRCVARVCRNRCGVNGLSSSARSPINRMILSIASFLIRCGVFFHLQKDIPNHHFWMQGTVLKEVCYEHLDILFYAYFLFLKQLPHHFENPHFVF